MDEIVFTAKNQQLTISNSWEGLTPAQYIHLVEWLQQMTLGEMSYDEVRLHLLCDVAGWDLRRVKDEDALANLLAMAERITFPLTADGDRLELNLNWFAQLLPSVVIGGTAYRGYRADMKHGALYCSLTALQYIEARELINRGAQTLPLLAAILYCPGDYDSGKAMQLADTMARLPATTLSAIQWNFLAVHTFLMTRPPFSLLTRFEQKPSTATIVTDSTDSLYDLCADGVGNHREVELMNMLTYLRLLRKKTIDGVRQMRQAKMDTPTISTETGLPLEVINEII